MSNSPNKFTEFINRFEPSLPAMPLIHTTDAYRFSRHILKKRLIEPQPCEIFEEDLLYFFYGRPSYRVNSNQKKSFSAAYPVGIILHPDAVKYAKRVYPFDTGAYAGGLFEDYMYKDFTLDSFLVDLCLEESGLISISDIPSKIIAAFFENNTNYYYADKFRSIPDRDMEFDSFEAECYLELIRTKAEKVFDDRRSSIEVQIAETVDVLKDSIWAIVLPQSFLENERIQNVIIDELRVEPVTYPTFRSEPDFLIPIIMDRVGQFFSKEGLI